MDNHVRHAGHLILLPEACALINRADTINWSFNPLAIVKRLQLGLDICPSLSYYWPGQTIKVDQRGAQGAEMMSSGVIFVAGLSSEIALMYRVRNGWPGCIKTNVLLRCRNRNYKFRTKIFYKVLDKRSIRFEIEKTYTLKSVQKSVLVL